MKNFQFTPRLVSELRHYSKEKFAADAMAGLIVGIVALPLAIAFGIASGVTPEKGIITAIVAGFLISLLGGTKVQIGGPTGAFIVIIYGIVTNPSYGLQGLLIATMMAGVILIGLGVFKLGAVIKFIPYPIIIGFTAGIAVTIFTTQMGDVLGLTQQAVDKTGNVMEIPLKTPGDFIGKWVAYAQNIGTCRLWNFIVAVGSLLVIIFSPAVFRRVPVLNKIPGSLYGILLGTAAVLVPRPSERSRSFICAPSFVRTRNMPSRLRKMPMAAMSMGAMTALRCMSPAADANAVAPRAAVLRIEPQ